MKHLRLLSRLEGACLLIAEDKLRLITEKVTLPIFLGQSEAVEHLPAGSLVAYRGDAVSAGTQNLPKVGVIEVFDSLVSKSASAASGMTSYQSIAAQIDSAIAQGFSKIVFNIDSPGGEASGLFSLTDKIRKLADRNIETIAYADGMACSAAYGIFAACQKTYATETSILGSIGVLMVHVDTSAKDAADGKTYTILRSKSEKALGDSHSPLSEQAVSKMQLLLDTMDAAFNNDISASRGLSVDQIKSMKGSEFMAGDALKLGLVDKIVSGFDEALNISLNSNSTLKGGLMTHEEALSKVLSLEAEKTVLEATVADLTTKVSVASDSAAVVASALAAQKVEFTSLLATAPTLRMDAETVAGILEDSPTIASALVTMKHVAKFAGAAISGASGLQSTVPLSAEDKESADKVSDALAAYHKATGVK